MLTHPLLLASLALAQVFAGALKDNGRATIAGDDVSATFGKGVVQTVVPLGEDGEEGGLAITVAKWVRPNGEDINKKGVEVDVKVGPCGEGEVTCLPKDLFRDS
jgi:carboxyl-terminal processing protease